VDRSGLILNEINCRFLRRGACSLNRVDEVSVEFCQSCQDRKDARVKGIGDAVAVTIDKTPFRRFKKKGCGCRKRQKFLNRIAKFGKDSRDENKSD